MAGIGTKTAGFTAKLYRSNSALSDAPTPAAIVALAIPGNEIKGVSTMGEVTKTRASIQIPVYGADQGDQIPGQIESATFEFSYTLDQGDTVHTNVRDDVGTSTYGWIIAYVIGAKATYIAFNGRILSASLEQGLDIALTVNASVAREGKITWADKP